ncbi:SxtJ family membrane protein, partial [Amylibacter sp.]|nr:SxtJ family membrane protein [Amylibacter sp.]
LNKLWMSFGFLLGKIVSPLIIGIIFFALFTPIAVVMRLFGRDELRLRFKSKESHWINREISMQPNSFRNQF